MFKLQNYKCVYVIYSLKIFILNSTYYNNAGRVNNTMTMEFYCNKKQMVH